MIEMATRISAVIWGVPWLRGALGEYGIAVTDQDRDAMVAVIGVDRDADLHAIGRAPPGVPVLALVPRERALVHAFRILRTIELGATVMPSDAPVVDIAAALGDLIAGLAVVDPFVGEMVFRAVRARAVQGTQRSLGARERDMPS